MERILQSRLLIFVLILIPLVLGLIAYVNLHKKGALAEVRAIAGGGITLQASGSPDRVAGKINSRLNSGDRLETGVDATTTLEFADGGEIEVAPESRVIVEKDETLIPAQTTLQVLVGSAKSTKVGSGRLVLITDLQAREVGAVTLPELSAGHEPESSLTTTTTSSSTTTLSSKNSETVETAAGDANSLPSEYIESVVRGQRAHISKCFSDLLQKSTQAHGRMDLSFTIEGSGKTARVRVLGSTLSDSVFNGCITQVFEHLQFKTFQGEPIIVNYPLQFQ